MKLFLANLKAGEAIDCLLCNTNWVSHIYTSGYNGYSPSVVLDVPGEACLFGWVCVKYDLPRSESALLELVFVVVLGQGIESECGCGGGMLVMGRGTVEIAAGAGAGVGVGVGVGFLLGLGLEKDTRLSGLGLFFCLLMV